MIRAVLSVPGHCARFYERARTTGADAVVIDWEDGVPQASKATARVITAVQMARGGFPMPVGLRVACGEDLERVPAGVSFVVWPKARWPLPKSRLPLWVVIESPQGVVDLPALLAQPQVQGVVFGASDFAASYGLWGVEREQNTRFAMVKQRVILEAKSAGKCAVDSPWLALGDPDAGAGHYATGAGWGFDGAIAIHPDQVATIQAAYRRPIPLHAIPEGGMWQDSDGTVYGPPHTRIAGRA